MKSPSIALLAVAVLTAFPATADCLADFTSAIQTNATSGPYIVATDLAMTNASGAPEGAIDIIERVIFPDRIYVKVRTNRQGFPGSDTVIFGDQTWQNKGGGWIAGSRDYALQAQIMLQSSGFIPSAKFWDVQCLGHRSFKNNDAITFSYRAMMYDTVADMTIYFDPMTKRPIQADGSGPNLVLHTLYKFDPTMKIEPPL